MTSITLPIAKGSDDTAALNALFARAPFEPVRLKAGVYRISQPLAPVVGNCISITADPGVTIEYVGTNPNPGDLLTFGDGVNSYTDLDLRGFTIGSTCSLSSGFAVRIKKYTNVELDLRLNGRPGQQGNLSGGVWLDRTSTVNLHTSRFYCRHKGLLWNNGVELHCMNAWVGGQAQTGIGIHAAGGCGGFYSECLTQLFNDIGMLIDHSVSPEGNTQFFFDGGTFDSNKNAAVYVNDTVSNPVGKVIRANGWFASSTVGSGFVIVNWKDGTLTSDGVFRNNAGHGLYLGDPSARVRLGKSADIAHNGIDGVNAASAMSIYSSAVPRNNGGLPFSTNITVM